MVIRSRSPVSGGFTLVEVLVVIGIISMLMALLMPALHRARDASHRTACASNLRQIALAVQMYAQENRQWMPPKFDVKKATLKPAEIAEGKRLNTLENGIQTVLAKYTLPTVFSCPSDSGDAGNDTPVVLRRGTSFDVQGHDLKVEKDPKKAADKRLKNRYSAKHTREIARDLFKPWDSDDPKKVADKISKGELGPVKWHRKLFSMVMADGHVVTIASKAEDKEAKGEASDD